MHRAALSRIVLEVMVIAAGWISGAAIGADLAREFPADSIHSSEEARRALVAARKEVKRVEDAYKQERERCSKDFFVNACEERARRERNRARAEAERVELEARDRQRALDAEARDQRKAKANVEQEAITKEIGPRNDARRPRNNAQDEQRRVSEAKVAAENRIRFEAKQADHAQREAERNAPDATARREANANALAEKKLRAQEHAEAKGKQKADNERRRAERKRQRDEEAAKQNGQLTTNGE